MHWDTPKNKIQQLYDKLTSIREGKNKCTHVPKICKITLGPYGYHYGKVEWNKRYAPNSVWAFNIYQEANT